MEPFIILDSEAQDKLFKIETEGATSSIKGGRKE